MTDFGTARHARQRWVCNLLQSGRWTPGIGLINISYIYTDLSADNLTLFSRIYHSNAAISLAQGICDVHGAKQVVGP